MAIAAFFLGLFVCVYLSAKYILNKIKDFDDSDLDEYYY